MKQAYENMRRFWMHAANFTTRKGVIELGADRICAAGVEMAFADGEIKKHLLIATNSLGDCSLYFENNSKSGLGGVVGGHGNEALQTAAAHMLAHASKMTGQMTALPAGQEFPPPQQAGQVCLFALSKEKLFYVQFEEAELRREEHPFYPFFAYSQQTLGFFRQQDSQASGPAGRA